MDVESPRTRPLSNNKNDPPATSEDDFHIERREFATPSVNDLMDLDTQRPTPIQKLKVGVLSAQKVPLIQLTGTDIIPSINSGSSIKSTRRSITGILKQK